MSWKTVRVFISSTFKDTQAERDHLVRFVFPRLREELTKRRIHFVDVDLRWGVAPDQDPFDLCMEEIDGCRPRFLCILGERYGWIPAPKKIAQSDFNNLQASFTAEQTLAFNSLYRLDPQGTEYEILPEPEDPIQRAEWEQTSSKIIRALKELYYEGLHSITAAEIFYGALNRPDIPAFRYFYFRDPAVTETIPPPYAEDYREPEGSFGNKALAKLKQRILNSTGLKLAAPGQPKERPFPYFVYNCRWDFKSNQIVGLRDFGDHVYSDLLDSVDAEFGIMTTSIAPGTTHEVERTEEFVEAHQERYILGSRTPLFEKMHQHAKGTGANYLVITGAPGIGKSALLSRFYTDIQKNLQLSNADDIVIGHFIGVSPGSTNLVTTLHRLCAEISLAAGIRKNIPDEFYKLQALFHDLISEVTSARKLVIVLDAINELERVYSAESMLWLPQNPGPNLRMILSTQPSVALENLKKREIDVEFLELLPLEPDDVMQIINQFLNRYRKKLDKEQLQILLTKKDARNPLYLLAALEELRTLGVYEEFTHRIQTLPGETHLLFAWILERLENDPGFVDQHSTRIGRDLVRRFCSLIAIARSGVPQNYLMELAWPGAPAAQPDKYGNVAALQRLLRPYLMNRGESIDFFHGQLKQAVLSRYLSKSAEALQVHREFASYLLTKADPEHDRSWRGTDPYSFRELPFHLGEGEMWDLLEGTLSHEIFQQRKMAYCSPHEFLDDLTNSVRSACNHAPEFAALQPARFAILQSRIRNELPGPIRIVLDFARQQQYGTCKTQILSLGEPYFQSIAALLAAWQSAINGDAHIAKDFLTISLQYPKIGIEDSAIQALNSAVPVLVNAGVIEAISLLYGKNQLLDFLQDRKNDLIHVTQPVLKQIIERIEITIEDRYFKMKPYLELAEIYELRGLTDQAEDLVRKAAENAFLIDPPFRRAKSLSMLLLTAFAKREQQFAGSICETIRELDPTEWKICALMELGIFLFAQGAKEEFMDLVHKDLQVALDSHFESLSVKKDSVSGKEGWQVVEKHIQDSDPKKNWWLMNVATDFVSRLLQVNLEPWDLLQQIEKILASHEHFRNDLFEFAALLNEAGLSHAAAHVIPSAKQRAGDSDWRTVSIENAVRQAMLLNRAGDSSQFSALPDLLEKRLNRTLYPDNLLQIGSGFWILRDFKSGQEQFERLINLGVEQYPEDLLRWLESIRSLLLETRSYADSGLYDFLKSKFEETEGEIKAIFAAVLGWICMDRGLSDEGCNFLDQALKRIRRFTHSALMDRLLDKIMSQKHLRIPLLTAETIDCVFQRRTYGVIAPWETELGFQAAVAQQIAVKLEAKEEELEVNSEISFLAELMRRLQETNQPIDFTAFNNSVNGRILSSSEYNRVYFLVETAASCKNEDRARELLKNALKIADGEDCFLLLIDGMWRTALNQSRRWKMVPLYAKFIQKVLKEKRDIAMIAMCSSQLVDLGLRFLGRLTMLLAMRLANRNPDEWPKHAQKISILREVKKIWGLPYAERVLFQAESAAAKITDEVDRHYAFMTIFNGWEKLNNQKEMQRLIAQLAEEIKKNIDLARPEHIAGALIMRDLQSGGSLGSDLDKIANNMNIVRFFGLISQLIDLIQDNKDSIWKLEKFREILERLNKFFAKDYYRLRLERKLLSAVAMEDPLTAIQWCHKFTLPQHRISIYESIAAHKKKIRKDVSSWKMLIMILQESLTGQDALQRILAAMVKVARDEDLSPISAMVLTKEHI